MTWSLHNIVERLLNLFLGIVGFFLILRIILRLLSANPGTPFVAWVYDISGTLMSPFRGIFVNPTVPSVQGTAVFDIVALVAFIFYSLVVYFLIVLVDSVTPRVEEHPRQARR